MLQNGGKFVFTMHGALLTSEGNKSLSRKIMPLLRLAKLSEEHKISIFGTSYADGGTSLNLGNISMNL